MNTLKSISRFLRRVPEGVTIILLFYFCFLPIISVIIYGVSANASRFSVDSMARILMLLENSLKLAFCTTVISVSFAAIATFALHRLKFRGRGFLRILMLLPLVNPSFVGSLSFIMLFGTRGLISHDLLGLSISPYGFHGVLFLQVMSFTTIAYLIISGSVNSTNIDLEDAARNMGASEVHILSRITFPMMLPEIAVASLLVFLSSMADFTTPVVIGGNFKTLASDLYVQIIGVYDMKTASITGIFLLVPCFLAFLIQERLSKKRKFSSDGVSAKNILYIHCPRSVKALFIGLTAILIFLFCLIFIFIFVGAFTKAWGHDYSFTLEHASAVLAAGFRQYLKPLRNSVVLALVTGFATAALGTVLAYCVHQKKIVCSWLVDMMCLLPAAVPGILFGIGYLVTFKYSLFGIGQFILPAAPKIVLLGTTAIMYFICIARQMNLSMKSCYALLDHIEPDIINAAYNLGAAPWYATIRILVPMLKDAFMNAFLRIFSATMTTLGAIIFLILPKNKVLIQILFQITTNSKIGISCFVALLMSATTLIIMLAIYGLAYHRDIIYNYRRKYSHGIRS